MENQITRFVRSFFEDLEASIGAEKKQREFLDRLKNAYKWFEEEQNWGLK